MAKDSNDLNQPEPYHQVTVADRSGQELLEKYIRRRAEDLRRLHQALDQQDYELMRRIGHNLHGSGSAYDLRRISMLGERLERAAEQADKPALARIIADMEQFLATIVIKTP